MNIYTRKHVFAILFSFILLMLVGTFYDYQISQMLYDPHNPFGIIFSGYGQLPAMLCVCFGASLLMKNAVDYRNKKDILFILTIIFSITLHLFIFWMLSFDTLTYIDGMPLPASMMIAVLIILFVNIAVNRGCKVCDKVLVGRIAWFLILTPALSLLIVNVIKIFWGRPRMRMISMTPEASFQPWWIAGSSLKNQLLPLGVLFDEFKSFPSAHTSCAACAMAVSVLPLLNENFKGNKDILFYCAMLLTFLVGLARIIAGAHFLSDITAGMLVTFLVEYILTKLILEKPLR